ncbi:MAG: hypothetical protein J5825_09400 [Lachnospiraceae bacterium]|nr:hypothetical protein [Lachnospiraceae bacterium]
MFLYYINVPLNEEGIREFEAYDEKMAHVKTYELFDEDYALLRKNGGLFDLFDKELGTFIDFCEEERIELDQLDHAILLVQKYLRKSLDERESKACELILESLNTAKTSGTFWEIDIMLE